MQAHRRRRLRRLRLQGPALRATGQAVQAAEARATRPAQGNLGLGRDDAGPEVCQQELGCALEFTGAIQEDSQVVAGDAGDLVVLDSVVLRLLEMGKGARVIPGLVFGEAEEARLCPGWARIRRPFEMSRWPLRTGCCHIPAFPCSSGPPSNRAAVPERADSRGSRRRSFPFHPPGALASAGSRYRGAPREPRQGIGRRGRRRQPPRKRQATVKEQPQGKWSAASGWA